MSQEINRKFRPGFGDDTEEGPNLEELQSLREGIPPTVGVIDSIDSALKQKSIEEAPLRLGCCWTGE